jgi:pyruvate formate lyase activating enzyme
MRDVTDVFRVDLKAWSEEQYRELGGRFAPVMAAIAEAKRLGYWVEVVTLVVPGFNDDRRGLRGLADAIAAIDPSIPWHLNGFQPRYRMQRTPRMNEDALVTFAGTAYARDLRFVYVGNVEGTAFATTYCHACRAPLVQRRDFSCTSNAIERGVCPSCDVEVPGIFSRR